MTKPLILCSGSTEQKQFSMLHLYSDAILRAGGVPVLLTPRMTESDTRDLLSAADGLLLCGGVDWDPARYGEEALPELGEVSSERDTAETLLIREALRVRMPIFGICRGMQSLNVVCGGTLWQDLPTQQPTNIHHWQMDEVPENEPSHGVKVTEGTMLHSVLGTSELRVNSLHHQAVKQPAPGWTVSAVSEDGIIEAMENMSDGVFRVSVQWHPERLHAGCVPHPDLLFRAFCDACRR